MENTNMPCVGYAYVKPQVLNQVFEPCEALVRGTLFPELYLPIQVYGKCPCGEKGVCER